MAEVLQITGLKTKKDTVELGLKTLLELKKQAEIKQFKITLLFTARIRNSNYAWVKSHFFDIKTLDPNPNGLPIQLNQN